MTNLWGGRSGQPDEAKMRFITVVFTNTLVAACSTRIPSHLWEGSQRGVFLLVILGGGVAKALEPCLAVT